MVKPYNHSLSKEWKIKSLLTPSLTKCLLRNISTDIIKYIYERLYVEPCAWSQWWKWSKRARTSCPGRASSYSWTRTGEEKPLLTSCPLESAETLSTLSQMNDTQENLKGFSWKYSLNNWDRITTRWNTSILIITHSQMLAISSSASEGWIRLSRQYHNW